MSKTIKVTGKIINEDVDVTICPVCLSMVDGKKCPVCGNEING